MEYEYDSIFYQWIGIEKTELYYEVHLVQLDEGFFYDVYFDNEITSQKLDEINNLVENFKKNYNYNGDDYAGFISVSKDDDIIHIYLDIGNVLPENEKISAQGVLKLLNDVDGIKKVMINDFEKDYDETEINSDERNEEIMKNFLISFDSAIEENMKANYFLTKFKYNSIEYIRVLNKQIYQVIKVSCWDEPIPQNEFYFSVGIKIMPICAPNLYKGMLKEAIDVKSVIENRSVNFNVVNMRCEQENVNMIINQIVENVIPELNSIESYKDLYKKIINGCGYLEDVYTNETKLWLFFICDEDYEQYDRCIELAKSYRASEEWKLTSLIENREELLEKYTKREKNYSSDNNPYDSMCTDIKNEILELKHILECEIPHLKSIEELFENYKTDELNIIVKQTEEKNLKELKLIGLHII